MIRDELHRPSGLRWLGAVLLIGIGLALGARGSVAAAPAGRLATDPPASPQTASRPPAQPLNLVPVSRTVSPSPAVYPEQRMPLVFDHARHLQRGIACTDCHDRATTSPMAHDNLLPRGSACDRCHTAIHAAPERADRRTCVSCHTVIAADGRTARPAMPTPRLHFSHALHAARGASCETCHADMGSVRLATTAQLPTEATCLTCHDGRRATARCGACHPADQSGRLVTDDPADLRGPKLVPRDAGAWGAAHDLSFVQDHAGIAKSNPSLCQTCHDDRDCVECHNGEIRPLRIHNADYITSHALDARSQTQNCQACHRMQSDCRACHERLRVVSGERGNFGVGSPLRFHPDGWAGPPGELAIQGHAAAAQRNMAACVSCHEEQTCMWCHATPTGPRPGLGANPHGPGFAGSLRCEALAARSHRSCLKCHPPGDPMLMCVQ